MGAFVERFREAEVAQECLGPPIGADQDIGLQIVSTTLWLMIR